MRKILVIFALVAFTVTSGNAYILPMLTNHDGKPQKLIYKYRLNKSQLLLRLFIKRNGNITDTAHPVRSDINIVYDDPTYKDGFYGMRISTSSANSSKEWSRTVYTAPPTIPYTMTIILSCPRYGDFSSCWVSW